MDINVLTKQNLTLKKQLYKTKEKYKRIKKGEREYSFTLQSHLDDLKKFEFSIPLKEFDYNLLMWEYDLDSWLKRRVSKMIKSNHSPLKHVRPWKKFFETLDDLVQVLHDDATCLGFYERLRDNLYWMALDNQYCEIISQHNDRRYRVVFGPHVSMTNLGIQPDNIYEDNITLLRINEQTIQLPPWDKFQLLHFILNNHWSTSIEMEPMCGIINLDGSSPFDDDINECNNTMHRIVNNNFEITYIKDERLPPITIDVKQNHDISPHIITYILNDYFQLDNADFNAIIDLFIQIANLLESNHHVNSIYMCLDCVAARMRENNKSFKNYTSIPTQTISKFTLVGNSAYQKYTSVHVKRALYMFPRLEPIDMSKTNISIKMTPVYDGDLANCFLFERNYPPDVEGKLIMMYLEERFTAKQKIHGKNIIWKNIQSKYTSWELISWENIIMGGKYFSVEIILNNKYIGLGDHLWIGNSNEDSCVRIRCAENMVHFLS
uniref:Uncharacterized protein n=1 Tax=Megaviridae environmental sample TaxID=1737588 RepID=A0A5J6VHQ0_9VIRU|nr:MAG: hypothetical protein [Megaviridae environmental sample]